MKLLQIWVQFQYQIKFSGLSCSRDASVQIPVTKPQSMMTNVAPYNGHTQHVVIGQPLVEPETPNSNYHHFVCPTSWLRCMDNFYILLLMLECFIKSKKHKRSRRDSFPCPWLPCNQQVAEKFESTYFGFMHVVNFKAVFIF